MSCKAMPIAYGSDPDCTPEQTLALAVVERVILDAISTGSERGRLIRRNALAYIMDDSKDHDHPYSMAWWVNAAFSNPHYTIRAIRRAVATGTVRGLLNVQGRHRSYSFRTSRKLQRKKVA